jgi:hypothetical protein
MIDKLKANIEELKRKIKIYRGGDYYQITNYYKMELFTTLKYYKNFAEYLGNDLKLWKKCIDFLDVSKEDNEKTGEIKCELIAKGMAKIEYLEKEIKEIKQYCEEQEQENDR